MNQLQQIKDTVSTIEHGTVHAEFEGVSTGSYEDTTYAPEIISQKQSNS